VAGGYIIDRVWAKVQFSGDLCMSSGELLILVSNHLTYCPYCMFLNAHPHMPYYCRMESAVQTVEKKQRITRRWTDGAYVGTRTTIEEDCKVIFKLNIDATERSFLFNLIRMYSGN
jgi:hypothetical protein